MCFKYDTCIFIKNQKNKYEYHIIRIRMINSRSRSDRPRIKKNEKKFYSHTHNFLFKNKKQNHADYASTSSSLHLSPSLRSCKFWPLISGKNIGAIVPNTIIIPELKINMVGLFIN